MKKVKMINGIITLVGRNVVNKEGTDCRNWNRWASTQSNVPFIKTDNIVLAKANYYKNGDTIERVVKITGDCIRHNAFGTVNNATMKEDNTTWIAYTASMEALIRGFFRGKKGESAKKKGALTVTDAELDNGAMSQIENHGTSGAKVDSSFYGAESLGKTHYTGEFYIDLSELQVSSCCDTFDRQSVPTNLQPLYEKQLKANGIEFKKVALRKKHDVQPELCYQFSDRTVNDIVNYFIARLSELYISNNTAYAKVESITAEFVYEDGTREEVKIKNGELEKKFEVASQYVEADYDEALAAERLTRELIEKTKQKEPKKSKKGKKGESNETADESK